MTLHIAVRVYNTKSGCGTETKIRYPLPIKLRYFALTITDIDEIWALYF